MFGGDNNHDENAGAPVDENNGQPQATDQSYGEPQDNAAPQVASPAVSDDVMSNDHAGHDDLLSLKQQALQQLSPLVSHLDQTPEEKFRTTMMMIQAADNAALLKDAYDAAQTITDEKAKAQALLDVINEINYFTQQHDEQ